MWQNGTLFLCIFCAFTDDSWMAPNLRWLVNLVGTFVRFLASWINMSWATIMLLDLKLISPSFVSIPKHVKSHVGSMTRPKKPNFTDFLPLLNVIQAISLESSLTIFCSKLMLIKNQKLPVLSSTPKTLLFTPEL